MIAPYKHVDFIDNLNAAEIKDMFDLLVLSKNMLLKQLNPDGFNIGMNIGRTAGAGVVGHVHVHIVPRWNGDTNFMPVVSGTKVISQSLDALYKTLKRKA